MNLLTSIDSVRQAAGNYLFWLAIAPAFCVWPFLFDGVYIGMTKTVEMRNCMLISMASFFIVVHFSAAAFGNHGLWIGIFGFHGNSRIDFGIVVSPN